MDITRITDISFHTDTNVLQLLDCLSAHPARPRQQHQQTWRGRSQSGLYIRPSPNVITEELY